MMSLTYFAGWGPCGSFNSAGESEWDWVGVGLVVVALLLGLGAGWWGRWLRTSKHRIAHPLGWALSLASFAPPFFAFYDASVYIVDHFFGDANTGLWDGPVPCDPTSNLVAGVLFLCGVAGIFALRASYKLFKETSR